jgi:hypothetical protein
MSDLRITFDSLFDRRNETPECFLRYKLASIRWSYINDTRWFHPHIEHTEVSHHVYKLCLKVKKRENTNKVILNPSNYLKKINEAWTEYYDLKNEGIYPKGFKKNKPNIYDVKDWVNSKVIINLLIDVKTIGYNDIMLNDFYKKYRERLNLEYRCDTSKKIKRYVFELANNGIMNFGEFDNLDLKITILLYFRKYLRELNK